MKNPFSLDAGKRIILTVCATAIIACVLTVFLYSADGLPYFVRSFIKLVIFISAILFIGFRYPILDVFGVLKISWKALPIPLAAGIGIFAVIVGAFWLFSGYFDLSSITNALTENLGVDRALYPVIAIYIPIVNAFAEEFFFRGMLFIALRRVAGEKTAFVFSTVLFAAYHVVMLDSWGSFWLLALIMFGIFAGGAIFNLLDRKSSTIYPSYFTHMFANLAINYIGFVLFGLIG